MASVKIKVHRKKGQKGKGYGDVKFTPEQKAQIKAETDQAIVKGYTKRNLYQNLSSGNDEELLNQTIANDNGGATQALLFGKLNQLSKKADLNASQITAELDAQQVPEKFRKLKNKERLLTLWEGIPDLNEYPLKVISMIVDNTESKLTDDQARAFYDLSDIILNNDELLSLFGPDDLVIKYNEPQTTEDFMQSMEQGNQHFQQQQEELKKSEARTLLKIHDLSKPGSATQENFEQLKEILPGIESAYNTSIGVSPKKKIPKLGIEKINQVFPVQQRIEELKQLQEQARAMEEENRFRKHEYDVMYAHNAKLIDEFNTLKGDLEALEKEKDNFERAYGDVDAISTKIAKANSALEVVSSPKNIKQWQESKDTNIQRRQFLEKLINDIAKGNRNLLKLDRDVQKGEEELLNKVEEYDVFVEKLKAVHQKLKDEGIQLSDASEHLASLPATPIRPPPIESVNATPFQTPMETIGEGIRVKIIDPYAIHGRFKNGHVRKHAKKDPNRKYNPRNPLHFIQRKEGNRFSGGMLSKNEAIEKILAVNNTGQNQKALSMLESLSEFLSKKEYDKVFKMISS